MKNGVFSRKGIIYLLLILIVFLPRSIQIAGIYSFRVPIIICFLLLLYSAHGKIRFNIFLKKPLFWLYFIYACLRYYAAGQITTGIGIIVDCVLVLYCAASAISKQKDFEEFTDIFLSFMIIYSLLGVIECFIGFNIWFVVSGSSYGPSLNVVRFGLHRSYGSFSNYMNNGTFLMLSCPLSMWKIQSSKKLKYWIAYILIICNVLATLTRAAILGVLVLHIIWWIKSGILNVIRKNIIKVIGLIIFLIFICQNTAIISIFKSFISMFVSIIDITVASDIAAGFGTNARGIGQRFDLYNWVWESIQNNKWLGAGPTSVFNYGWTTPTGRTAYKESIENQYLINLYKYGLSGLLMYLLMIGTIIVGLINVGEKEALRVLDNKIRRFTFSFLVSSCVIVYFAMGLMHAYIDEFRMFFILLGILISYVKSLGSSLGDIRSG
ncbi:MAG: O-antigen ligase family protein [Lachnospiraceae bacterium]|nr:O-antigen ligase family protein [Lachnospiraceae bacterium]